MKKLAIIGASYLQEPLIQKAKDMGIETHVFAWAADDVGEKSADYFYPISIVEKEQILEKCREIKIDGICSIASDLAAITVNYVATELGLCGNDYRWTELMTNKHKMREAFLQNGDPSPKFFYVESIDDINVSEIRFPVIVKPLDRSGSRGITKVEVAAELQNAIEIAKEQGFRKSALVEEYVDGEEYSVEYISQEGIHHFLAVTKKYTTGSPNFIETGHLEPAEIKDDVLTNIKKVIPHALDSLHITNGASHSEIKISNDGDIKIIEIGARMGGDCIGSHLVELSTGIDFVKAVIDVALSRDIDLQPKKAKHYAAVAYSFSMDNYEKTLREIEKAGLAVKFCMRDDALNVEVHDSSARPACVVFCGDNCESMKKILDIGNGK